MSCIRQITSYSGAWGTRTGFLFCLFALLPYLLLPLIYYDHLTGTQDSLGYSIAAPQNRAPVMGGHVATPLRPGHDPACPICGGASHFQDYGIAAVVLAPDLPCLARLSPLGNHYCRIAHLHLLVSGSRGPPVFS